MADEAVCALGIVYTATVRGGVAGLLDTLRTVGATSIGRYAPRVPIDVAIASASLFEYVDAVVAASDAGWTAKIGLAPLTWIAIAWPQSSGGTRAATTDMFARLLELGDVEFAAVDVVTVPEVESRITRASLLARFDGGRYLRFGPTTLGSRTVIGNRLLSVLEPQVRDALVARGQPAERALVMGDGEQRDERLAEAFDASAVVQGLRIDPAGFVRFAPGRSWVPPSAGSTPRSLARKAASAIKKLQATSTREEPAEDIDLTHVIAPFSALSRIRVDDAELEGATLAFSTLEASVIRFSGAVEADLRAVDAKAAEWLDCSFHSADLRWADLSNTRFAASTFDGANLCHAVLSDSEILESAVDACFDHVTALRWKPDAPDFPATMTGATFRNAVLHEARFVGTQLERAVFDGADLTGASFTNAKLRGASFRGATLTDTTFTDCDLDGALFDQPLPSA